MNAWDPLHTSNPFKGFLREARGYHAPCRLNNPLGWLSDQCQHAAGADDNSHYAGINTS